jgi:hypothetical protein
MAVEEVRVRLRGKLDALVGAEEASFLMDRPPGGWNDLVTNHTLDLKIDALRYELRSEMAGLRGEMAGLRGEMAEFRGELHADMSALSASVDQRQRAQTWMMMSTMIAAVGLTVTLSHL